MKKRVLVIDDDRAICQAIEVALSLEGYDVMTLVRGDEAVACARTFAPHLILLDFLLSGKDGGEVARELRAHKHTKTIPIVLLSAHPNVDDVAAHVEVDAYIAKPFGINDLISKVAALM